MDERKKQVIVVELTNRENASASWDDVEATIKEFPYFAKLRHFGGGYFSNFEEIRKFFSRIKGAENINGCGEWEVEYDEN